MIVSVTLVTLIVLLLFFFKIKDNEHYWKRRGVVFWKKSDNMGVFRLFLSGQRPMFMIFDEIYKEFGHVPAVAFSSFLTPSILLKNLVNINHVTTSDFNTFSHRGLAYREDDKLANNVAFAHGPKWKILRQALSPLFTPSKLKKMHYIVDKCAKDFILMLKSDPKNLKGDAFMAMKTFSCAALAGAVFGMGTESPLRSPFLKLTKEALAPTFWRNFSFSLSGMSPQMFKFFGMSLFSVQEESFIDIIKHAIKERKESKDNYHDFVELCVDLQKKGMLFDPDTEFKLKPTDELMAAQAFTFFLAGLDPCAAGLFGTLFELGRNPEMHKRLQQEIDAAFEKYNGDLTYDAIAELKYLDKVIKEALRMHPPLAFITRECVGDAELPVGNIKIDKGSKVYIPIYSLHHDSSYFPDPAVFDPERFSNEKEMANFYIPFGQGSRICIGQRYALIQIKTGIVHVLRHFNIESHLKNGIVNYKKDYMFARLKDVDFAMVPRNKTY